MQQLAHLGADLGFHFLGAVALATADGFLEACQISLAGRTVAEVALHVLAERRSKFLVEEIGKHREQPFTAQSRLRFCACNGGLDFARQLIAEEHSGAVQAYAYCAFAKPSDARDFLGGEFFHVVEDQDHAIVRRDFQDRALQFFAILRAQKLLFRAAFAGSGERLEFGFTPNQIRKINVWVSEQPKRILQLWKRKCSNRKHSTPESNP